MISFTNKDLEALAMMNPASANNNKIDVDALIARAHLERSEQLRKMVSAVYTKLSTAHRTRSENNKAAAALYNMSSRELADIGISRGEIDRAVFGETAVKTSVYRKAVALMTSTLNRYSEWRNHRHGFAQLLAMDARQLNDIGLTRGDIAAAVAGKASLANDNAASAANTNEGRQVS